MATEPPSGSGAHASGLNVFISHSASEVVVLDPGQATVYLYLTNLSSSQETVDLTLLAGNPPETPLGKGRLSVSPGVTSPTLLSVSFLHLGYTLNVGDRLALAASSPTGVEIYWDGPWVQSRLETTSPLP